jgi:hypothetical protein
VVVPSASELVVVGDARFRCSVVCRGDSAADRVGTDLARVPAELDRPWLVRREAHDEAQDGGALVGTGDHQVQDRPGEQQLVAQMQRPHNVHDPTPGNEHAHEEGTAGSAVLLPAADLDDGATWHMPHCLSAD